ncbi:HK97-gp10 family putative phage morphogenesis protein [Vreelandella boliviensis]|uniref:HK97-gp10 family putative phage morphogenesis protein n=1 Tax=Vreelandella boliviensis TaxID=223527 RepID=UPI001B8D48FE|nr:HK97-gp10 family putative phage morphogenesis protein [Halomonas boliviensis]MBS3670195.1 HK97 gp10 family phage protein [Halomonas boliviensis]
MTEPLNVNVEGLEPLLARMDNLSFDLRKKGGRFAMRKAANVIRDKARQNAAQVNDPKTPEEIAANIVVRFSPKDFKRNGNLVFRVGVLGGARGHAAASGEVAGKGKNNPGGDTFYWRFLEFGTVNMPAQPFARRALSENIQAATDQFVLHYNKSLDRAIKRGER